MLYGLKVLARTSPTGVSWKLLELASDITLALLVAFNNKLTLLKNASVNITPRLMVHVMLMVLDLLVTAAVAVRLLVTDVGEV